MLTPNQRLNGILGTVAFLLFIPLIAMQFTTEVDWKLADFLIVGLLLLGTGLLCELVLRRVSKTSHRWLICGLILLVMALVWLELAVGIFGTPFAGS